MSTITKKLIVIGIFSIAMAALEASVVAYLRALYYPNEFTVAFKIIDKQILLIEIIREVSTLVMLCTVGYLAGKNLKERLAYFLLSFALWDIFYYGWLKVFIDWPSSIFEWDILFLIPITWIGPVGAPVICSLTMIVLAFLLLQTQSNNQLFSNVVWSCLVAGSMLILFTFMKDYGELIIANGFTKYYPDLLQNKDFVAKASTYIPKPYSWNIFWAGELFIVIGMINFILNKTSHADDRESIIEY